MTNNYKKKYNKYKSKYLDLKNIKNAMLGGNKENKNQDINELCDKLEKKEDNINKIFETIYKKRNNKLGKLNEKNIINNQDFKGSYKYHFPNLDFLNNFENYIHEGEIGGKDCLCNLETTKTMELKKSFGKGKMGTATLYKYGNEDVILKTINNVEGLKYINLEPKFRSNLSPKYYNNNPSYMFNMVLFKKNDNNTNVPGILTARSDPFKNQTCMHLILNNLLKNSENYVYQYDAYYCAKKERPSFMSYFTSKQKQQNGHNLMPIAREGDLSKLIRSFETIDNMPTNFIYEMFYQLLKPLSILKSYKYGFSHNDFKCANVFVDKVNDKYIFKLADFDKASIFYNGIRFCISDDMIDIGGWSQINSKSLDYLNFKGFEVHNDSYYNMYSYIPNVIGNNLTTAISDRIASAGFNSLYTLYHYLPMHVSYDIYTFMISLLYEPIILHNYNRYIRDLNKKYNVNNYNMIILDKILRILFYPVDYEKIKDDINKTVIGLVKDGKNDIKFQEVSKQIVYASEKLGILGINLKTDLTELYQLFKHNYEFMPNNNQRSIYNTYQYLLTKNNKICSELMMKNNKPNCITNKFNQDDIKDSIDNAHMNLI